MHFIYKSITDYAYSITITVRSFSIFSWGNYSINAKFMAHFASRDIFRNHSVRGPETLREIVTDRRDRYLFCLHTISLVRYNCTVWFGASHNCPPLFAQRPRRKRRIREKKTGRVASIRMTSCTHCATRDTGRN